jgi:hypothetical protein
MASVSFRQSSAGHAASTRYLRRRSFSLTRSLHLPRAAQPWVRAAAALLLIFAICETGARLLEYVTDLPFDDARSATACKLTPGAMLGGRSVNSDGYWDDDFSAAAPDGVRRRLAVLGGLSTLSGDAKTNFTARLETMLPAVEIDHFGLPGAGPREHSAQLVRDVLRRKPGRILICLDATDDFAPRHVPKSPLECRSLQLVEALLTPATATALDTASPLTLTAPLEYDDYVRSRAASVLASHKSPRAELDIRRREAQAALERVTRICRKHDIPVTLVLVPGEFQLSSSLTAAFCRRMQCHPSELETELPQRRWSALAEHLQVSTIDLLPALRENGEIVYLPNSADWNDRGQTIVAETIARDLKNRGI